MKKNGIPTKLIKQSTELALRLNTVNIGFILVIIESYFRPFIFRFIEYLYWIILYKIKSKKHRFVSLGRGQVQFSHIQEYCIKNEIKPNINTIIKMCESMNQSSKLAEFALNKASNNDPLSKRYTGRYNSYYEELARELSLHMNFIIQKRKQLN